MRRDVSQAIADPVRREIIELLSEDTMSVNAIAENFEISRPAISKHLKILEKAQLVERTRRGRESWLRLNPGPLIEVQDWLKFHEKFWVDSFGNLDRILKKNLS